MEEVVRPRVAGRTGGEAMEDMLDAWLDRVEADAREPETDTTVDMECALYALEDILGGHSAVANIALRALIDLGARQEAQAEVRGEVRDALGSAQFSLEDRSLVPPSPPIPLSPHVCFILLPPSFFSSSPPSPPPPPVQAPGAGADGLLLRDGAADVLAQRAARGRQGHHPRRSAATHKV